MKLSQQLLTLRAKRRDDSHLIGTCSAFVEEVRDLIAVIARRKKVVESIPAASSTANDLVSRDVVRSQPYTAPDTMRERIRELNLETLSFLRSVPMHPANFELLCRNS